MNPQQPGQSGEPGREQSPGTGPAPGITVGYCRACGKALDAAGVRAAHGTIYCAEHAPPPAGAAPQASAPGSSGSGTGGTGAWAAGTGAGAGFGDSPYASPYASPYTGGAPPPLPNHDVSPGLAFLLGLIPGVGAVYNGQYGKGLVHVVIVGLLISVGLEPLLGLLLAAFWAYMAFEAFHTAKRRRLGQPVDEFSSVLPVHGGPNVPAAPVLLIALGVLFLLSNLGFLEIRRVLRYWPVLLIALGVYMLYVRLAFAARDNRRQDARPETPAGGGGPV
jgi:TM2 domain-containing membrane protein YozV